MQAQPGETRAVFLRAETKAFRNRNVRTLTLMTLRWSLGSRSLRAGFCFCLRVSESQQSFSTRGWALSCFKSPYTSISAAFCAFKRTTNFLPSNSLHKNSCDHHDHFLITNSSTIFPQIISKTCKLKLTTKNAA